MYVVGCLLGSDPCTCMYLLKRVMGGGGGGGGAGLSLFTVRTCV